MDTLSIELVWEIAQHLHSKSDLGNFRLIQRSFAPLARSFLFRSVLIRNSKYSFSRLLRISRKPELARHVKEVSLEVHSNAKYLIWPQFVGRLQRENIKYGDKSQKEGELEVFKSCIKEWYIFQKSLDYTAILSTAFARLPRLQNFTLAEGSELSLNLGFNYSYAKYHPFKKRSNFHGPRGLADLYRAFTGLVNAAYLADVKIMCFKVIDTTGGFAANISSQNGEILKRVAAVFHHCRTIELDLSSLYLGVPYVQKLQQCGAFSSSIDLEELNISSQTCSEPRFFGLVFGNNHVWPRLRRLGLNSVDFYKHELSGFLQRHKATLREISICGCILHTGSWFEIATIMKQSLKIAKLELSGLCNWSCNQGYQYQDCTLISEYIINYGELPEVSAAVGL